MNVAIPLSKCTSSASAALKLGGSCKEGSHMTRISTIEHEKIDTLYIESYTLHCVIQISPSDLHYM